MNPNRNLMPDCFHQQGFTLVELMIALAMSGLLVAAVYSAYTVQQKSYTGQTQVVEMQQNIRATLEMVTGDIRMAAYDPDDDAKASIIKADPTELHITMDLDNNGTVDAGTDVGEDITYKFVDGDGEAGITAPEWGKLVRIDKNTSAAEVTVAEKIEAIEFYYRPINNEFIAGTSITSAADLKKIQSVQLTILAVASQRTPNYVNDQEYKSVSNEYLTGDADNPTPNDGYRRRMLTQIITIRNRGL